MSKNDMAKSIAKVLVNEAKIDVIDRILGDHDTTEDPETTKQNIISKLMTKSNTEVWELYKESCYAFLCGLKFRIKKISKNYDTKIKKQPVYKKCTI